MGAPNALIISSCDISQASFIDFFEAYPCRWYSGHKRQAIVNDDHTEVAVCLMENTYSDMFDADELKTFTKALGAEPKTYLEISRTKDTDPNNLYMVVAKAMASRWTIAVHDIHENLVPYRDLIAQS